MWSTGWPNVWTHAAFNPASETAMGYASLTLIVSVAPLVTASSA